MSTILEDQVSAPTSVRYLTLLSAGSLIIFDLLAVMTITTLGTQGQDFLTKTFLPLTTVLSVASTIEWYYLRKSNSWKVALITYGVEITKTFAYGFFIPPLYDQFVGGGTNTFIFIPLMSVLTIGIFTAHKFAPRKYEWLTNRPLTKRFVNLLPTLVILSLFMGTYLVEISGLAPTRQTRDVLEWENRSINWDAFGPPPDWNARYYLEDLLSQFLNGINFPDEPIFNVTNVQPGASPTEPVTYWRLAALTTYKYEDHEPYYTDWSQLDSSIERLYSSESNLFFSRKIPDSAISSADSSQAGIFRVDIPLDLSSAVPNPQISASFPYYIPTTWNDQYGGFIDLQEASYPNPDSIIVPSTGETIFPVSVDVKEVQPSTYQTSDGIKLAMSINDGDVKEATGVTQYTVRYLAPDYLIFSYFSGNKSDYQRAVDAQTWEAIKALYLQVPNTPGVDMPSPANLPANVNNYATWAPNVYQTATNLNLTASQTVYNQVTEDLKALAANGTLGLQFDVKMWFREYAGNPPRPDPYQDFNEWFITTKNGTSLHFSSLLATVLRLQGIPSRIAYGFIGGNDTLGNFQKRVITQRFIHTWVEVLVPIRNPLNNYQLELRWMPLWFHLDPLFAYLAGAAAMTQQQTQAQAFLYDPIEYQKKILNNDFDFTSAWKTMNVTEIGDPTPDHIIGLNRYVTLTIGAMQIGGDVTGGGTLIPQGISNLKIKFGVVSADNSSKKSLIENFEAVTGPDGTASFTFQFNSSIITPDFGFGRYYLYAEANTTILVNGQPQNVTLQAWSRDVYDFRPTESISVSSTTEEKPTPAQSDNMLLRYHLESNSRDMQPLSFILQRFTPEEMNFFSLLEQRLKESINRYISRLLEWKSHEQKSSIITAEDRMNNGDRNILITSSNQQNNPTVRPSCCHHLPLTTKMASTAFFEPLIQEPHETEQRNIETLTKITSEIFQGVNLLMAPFMLIFNMLGTILKRESDEDRPKTKAIDSFFIFFSFI